MMCRREIIHLGQMLHELSKLTSLASSYCDSVANFREVTPERMELLRSDVAAIEERMAIVGNAIVSFERAAGIKIYKRVYEEPAKTLKPKRPRKRSGRAARRG